MANVTGFDSLLQGRVIQAGKELFESVLGAWFVTLLFLTFKIILYMKTKNITLSFVSSLFFLAIFSQLLDPVTFGVIIVIMTFELAGILYNMFWGAS